MTARVERDRNALRLQQLGHHAPGGVPVGGGRGKENASPEDAATEGTGGGTSGGTGGAASPDQGASGDVGFIRGYLDRIAHLEKEIRRLKEVRQLPAAAAALLLLELPGSGKEAADVEQCPSCCQRRLLKRGVVWRTQVQRCSGAFLMSARRASMGLGSPGSALKGSMPGMPGLLSPFPMSAYGASARSLDFIPATPGADVTPPGDGDLGGLAGDEEYAAEEHAHRCDTPQHM